MALETANNASELVATNPTPSDLVKTTDDHIRMIKRILKDGFQGHFTSLTLVRALDTVDGAWLTYNNSVYVVYTLALAEALPMVIKLTNNKVAIRTSVMPVGRSVLLPTASSQKRYPIVKQVTASSFDLTAVNAAFGGTPVNGDVVIVTDTNFIETRIFNGTWAAVDSTLFGYTSLVGTLTALSLMTPLAIVDRLRTQRIELLSSLYLEVNSPDGFGPDSLRYWYGKNEGVVDGNGNIAYNALSKTNAIEWKSQNAGGSSSGGGSSGGDTPVDGGDVVNNLGMGTAYICQLQSFNSNPATERARIVFGVNGTFSVLAYGDVVSGTPVTGNYVTTPSANTGALYEVKFEKISGDVVEGATNTYQQINAIRDVVVPAERMTVGVTEKTASIKIYVRKIGNAGSEKSVTVSLTARASVSGGLEP